MSDVRAALEAQLNDFDPAVREEALDGLLDLAAEGEIELPEPTKAFNLHCHSFFSFNGYGYSPTALAWIARCQGLSALSIVDFDVVEGVDEFLQACKLLGKVFRERNGSRGVHLVRKGQAAPAEINISPSESGNLFASCAG